MPNCRPSWNSSSCMFFLTFTKLCSEDFECMFTSTQDFGGVTEGSVWDCSINLDSHGLAAIQRSSQLHPQLFLSNSWFLNEYTELLVRVFELGFDLHCWKNKLVSEHG
jgi:hypothetical protein